MIFFEQFFYRKAMKTNWLQFRQKMWKIVANYFYFQSRLLMLFYFPEFKCHVAGSFFVMLFSRRPKSSFCQADFTKCSLIKIFKNCFECTLIQWTKKQSCPATVITARVWGAKHGKIGIVHDIKYASDTYVRSDMKICLWYKVVACEIWL